MDNNNEQTGYKIERKPDWYFGGLAGAGASMFTHPLDLIKVHMQTRKDKRVSTLDVAKEVVAKEGSLGLYNGLSASVLRQLTYSTARFGVYEYMKTQLASGPNVTLLQSLGMAGVAGVAGSIVGNPADLINVNTKYNLTKVLDNFYLRAMCPSRYLDEPPLSHVMRSSIPRFPDFLVLTEPFRPLTLYRHAFHGLYSVASKEGVTTLWTGTAVNAMRSAPMNIGQITFYAQCKKLMLSTGYFGDNVVTHILSSITAAVVATALTLPIDVVKTRTMNAKPGEPTGIATLVAKTASEGPLAFFKGFMPSLIRMIPQTVLTFVFFEQLTKYFGVIVRTPVK